MPDLGKDFKDDYPLTNMKIPIIFLGTSQAIPTLKRNHTAVFMQYKQENILIDCGEGTQRQFRKARLNPCKITRILITHWHGDHILGVPGLLETLSLSNYNKTLHVYGPKGTKRFMELMYRLFVHSKKIKIKIEEVSGRFLETPDFFIEAAPLEHGTPCNAYAFIEKDRLKLNKKKIKQLNLPNSPILGELQKGKNIRFMNKLIKAKDVSYTEKGRKISFLFDTKLTLNCYKIAKNSDLLISESTYTNEEKELASKYKHLTSKQAAEIAKKSKTKKLILTHLSQRYQNNEKKVLNEAKKIFKNTKIAEDLMRIEI